MPQRDDESVEEDLLLAFSIEPGGKPPDSTESLAARIDSLEKALHRSAGQIESLKSEVATLVGTVDDIGKNARRPVTWAPKPASTARRRSLTAAAGIVFGLALGALGWTAWSRGSSDAIIPIDTSVAASAAPAAPQRAAAEPVESAPSLQPVALLAATTPEPVTEPEPLNPARRPVQTARPPVDVRAPVDYVGTLTIDASPGGAVFIDREPAGQTPLRLQNLKAGSHLVWIEREGYRRFTRVVQVPADRVSRVFAELEPIPER